VQIASVHVLSVVAMWHWSSDRRSKLISAGTAHRLTSHHYVHRAKTIHMHNALLIEDIIKVIVAALASQQEGLRDLASLSRSCRVLSKPALDRIWESATVWNVARTMTEGSWKIEKAMLADGRGSNATTDADDGSDSSDDLEEVWTLVRTTLRSTCV
jgi:hypothetical protein